MTRLPHLCITSPWNYPLFNPACQSHFGGWEVRIALIAKELARRRGFGVSMVVGDHGQPHIEHREGVTLYSWIGRGIWGIPLRQEPSVDVASPPAVPPLSIRQKILQIFRANKPKSTGPSLLGGQVGTYLIAPQMISIYDEVGADIHMVPGNSQFSAEAAFYCLERGKKFAFLSGSDFDYYPEYKLFPEKADMYGVSHALKTYSIEKAAIHIVQNQRQADMLWNTYRRAAIIIPNPIDLTPLFPRNPNANTILWVGKSDERIKRPSIVLDLARHLPQYQFVIVMNLAIQATHDLCIEEAKELANVTLLERVPFTQIEGYFAAARLHINTSLFEGFPNTFLQAAKYGVPTVSLQVDPGTMLSQHGTGLICGGDFKKFKHNVACLMEDQGLYDTLSRRALQYVRNYHDKDVLIEKYERALLSIL